MSDANSWLQAANGRAVGGFLLTELAFPPLQFSGFIIHQTDFKRLLLADEMASPPPKREGAENQVPSAAEGLDWWSELPHRE